ncbi:MAG TPA: hypothetical protein VFU03_01845 [Gemmatimonadales bacterium]|nr:hypothetical protein [Gemmatimonadales bacterium]
MTGIPALMSLTPEEFAAVDPARRAISHEHARRHAMLHLGGVAGTYALSWRSDLVEPVLALDPPGEQVWMAVDQRVACIDLRSGEIGLRLALSSNALDIKFAGSCAAVLTETAVLLFNSTLTIRAVVGVPDLPESMTSGERVLTIRLQGGETRILEIDSGQLR